MAPPPNNNNANKLPSLASCLPSVFKQVLIIYNEISNRLNGGSKCFVIPINNLCCSDNQLEVVINILERNKIEAVVQFNKLGITWDKITTLILDNTWRLNLQINLILLYIV